MSQKILSWAVSALLFSSVTLSARAAEPVNVLFLFTDDQRADTIHALGNELIQTPAMDSLVENGFVFHNAYCMGSNAGAVCLPSRNMLMSGRAYFRWANQGERYASGEKPNFPDSLKAVGYETYHHGKQGNTAQKIHQRFDHTRYLKNDQAARRSGQPGKEIVDAALEFLEQRKAEKPFFMYLAFEAPHDPRVSDPEYRLDYSVEGMNLPANYLPLHPFNNGEQFVRDELLAHFPRTEHEVRTHLYDYYGAVTALDYQIGRLLARLKESGQYENTLILFSSDHGLAVGSHGLMGKQSLYEHAMKPPLIFSGPGIPKGESDALVYLLDLYPTVCELVGADIPEGLDGKSLAPVIKGEQAGVRDSLFLAYKEFMRAVRDERWKLIRYPHINKNQLFDLENDPDEMTNLADDPMHAPQVERLMGLMKEWQETLEDGQPLSSDAPLDPAFQPTQADVEAALKQWKQPAMRPAPEQ